MIHQGNALFPYPMVLGHKKLRPVPKTSNQLVQVFNQEERLALYEYAVSNTSHGFKLEPEM